MQRTACGRMLEGVTPFYFWGVGGGRGASALTSYILVHSTSHLHLLTSLKLSFHEKKFRSIFSISTYHNSFPE